MRHLAGVQQTDLARASRHCRTLLMGALPSEVNKGAHRPFAHVPRLQQSVSETHVPHAPDTQALPL